MTVRIKICCISNRGEARQAVLAGAAAIGLVGQMPSGPGVITDDRIRDIAQGVPPGVATFLLTSATTGPEIAAHIQRTHTNTVQIVDRTNPEVHIWLKQQFPPLKIVQVVHIQDESSIEEALSYTAYVDALLLDSGNPDLPVKTLGGTGRAHDWQISRRIREQTAVPVFLAGGLTPDNVRDAIDVVQPYGVDVCSGVRSAGKLDGQKLEKLFSAIYS